MLTLLPSDLDKDSGSHYSNLLTRTSTERYFWPCCTAVCAQCIIYFPKVVCKWKTSKLCTVHGFYLSVVQFEGCVVVVGVMVHPLVHHGHMAVDLLSPFLQWPVLSAFPPTALVCPAAQRQDIDEINVSQQWQYELVLVFKKKTTQITWLSWR